MMQPNFTPFPDLTTERLLLREITKKDTPEIFLLRSNAAVYQFLGKEPATSLKEAEDFIELINNNTRNNEAILWGIVLKEDPLKVIGTICFWRLDNHNYRAEIGYALLPAWWRKGIMKEAILKVLEYGYTTMGLHSVEARISAGNIPSSAILEATGFIKEAYFREDFFFRGNFSDTIVYSRLQ